jgi:hypothetical protein
MSPPSLSLLNLLAKARREVLGRAGVIPAACLSAAISLSLAGCGGETRVPVLAVSGHVTVNGEPAEGAQVFLHPQGHELPENVGAIGTVKSDGQFAIGSYESSDGVPPGNYVATVQWLKVVETEGGAGRGPNVLPTEYASPETSPVKLTVKDGPAELPIDIEVTKKR